MMKSCARAAAVHHARCSSKHTRRASGSASKYLRCFSLVGPKRPERKPCASAPPHHSQLLWHNRANRTSIEPQTKVYQVDDETFTLKITKSARGLSFGPRFVHIPVPRSFTVCVSTNHSHGMRSERGLDFIKHQTSRLKRGSNILPGMPKKIPCGSPLWELVG